jgi:hypothetical protein
MLSASFQGHPCIHTRGDAQAWDSEWKWTRAHISMPLHAIKTCVYIPKGRLNNACNHKINKIESMCRYLRATS